MWLKGVRREVTSSWYGYSGTRYWHSVAGVGSCKQLPIGHYMKHMRYYMDHVIMHKICVLPMKTLFEIMIQDKNKLVTKDSANHSECCSSEIKNAKSCHMLPPTVRRLCERYSETFYHHASYNKPHANDQFGNINRLWFLDKLIKDRGGNARALNSTLNSSPNFLNSFISIKGR